jgi:riboflavin biosynthesis pyrimidine reductase
MIGTVLQVYPAAKDAPVDLNALYGAPRPSIVGRPWVALSMITSLDGSTAVDRLSGGLGNDNDRLVFRTLRAAADVVLVGSGTASAERYGPSHRPGQRIGVVTSGHHGDLVDTELFSSGCGFLVVPENAEVDDRFDTVRAGHGVVDLRQALQRLGDLIPDVTFVLAEGGPRLNGGLLEADCLDELDLTVAPVLAGGDSSRLVRGATESLRWCELAHALSDDEGYLFTRWVRRDRAVSPGHPSPC